MQDQRKTKAQLIQELADLRQRVAALEAQVAAHEQADSPPAPKSAGRETELKFHALIERSPDGIMLVDETGKIIEWNPFHAKLSGLTREEVLGQNSWDVQFQSLPVERQTAERYESLKKMVLQAIETGQSPLFGRAVEISVRGADGQIHWLQQAIFLVRTERGNWLSSVTHDITRQKQIEAQVLQRNQELEAIGKILSATTTRLDLPAILDHALQGAMELSNAEGGTLCLVDPERQILILSAHHNASPEMVNDLQSNDIPIGECLCGEAARTGTPLILWDNASGSEYATRETVRAEGIRFHAAFPLRGQNHSIGVLCIFCRSQARPTQHSLDLVQDLCGPIAMAIENARLYQAEREQRELAETLRETSAALVSSLDLDTVLGRILEQVKRIVPNDASTILLIDGDLARFARWSGYESFSACDPAQVTFRLAETHNLQHMIRTGEALVIADTQTDPYWIRIPGIAWPCSYVGAPIRSRGQVIGFLDVNAVQPHTYTSRHAQRLQMFADHVAIAIENARLYQAEREQRAMADTLREVSAAVLSTLDADIVLDRILDQVGHVVPHDAANIMLIESRRARIVRWRGYDRAGSEQLGPGLELLIDQFGGLDRMMSTSTPVVISDTGADPEWVWISEDMWIRSYIGVPIRVRGETVGFLNVDSATSGFYHAGHAERLRAFADQAGLALENARLYQAEQKQREFAETLRQVGAMLVASLDTDVVLDRILELIGRVMPNDAANIMLIQDQGAHVVRSRGYEPHWLAQTIQSYVLSIPDTPTLRGMVETHQPIIIADTRTDPRWIRSPSEWLRSYMGAPIYVRGQVTGFLNLDSITPNFFQPEHAERLRSFADQVGIAFENARLFSMLDQEKKRIEFLYHLSQQLAASLDMREVAQRAVDDLRAVAGILLGLVTVREKLDDSEADWLRVVAVSGFTAEAVDTLNERLAMRVGKGVIGWVAEHRQPAVVDDVAQDERWMNIPGLNEWVRSVLCVPLLRGNELVGVLSIYSDQPAFFTPDVRRLVESAAATVAVAIANASLYATERQRATALTQALEHQRELDRLQREFMQNVSHELRTPLALIRGHAELLSAGDLGELQPEQSASLSVIVRRTQMLTKLLDDIISILNIEQQTMERKPVDLAQMVNLSLADFQVAAEKARITIGAELATRISPVMGDATALRRMLDNLVGNALKFTPAGGRVTVRLWQEGNRVSLVVADTGIGIPADKLDRIFERFYQVDGSTTRRYGGVGLGLALVKEITHLHQGQITVTSQVDAGTAFTVTLPIAPA